MALNTLQIAEDNNLEATTLISLNVIDVLTHTENTDPSHIEALLKQAVAEATKRTDDKTVDYYSLDESERYHHATLEEIRNEEILLMGGAEVEALGQKLLSARGALKMAERRALITPFMALKNILEQLKSLLIEEAYQEIEQNLEGITKDQLNTLIVLSPFREQLRELKDTQGIIFASDTSNISVSFINHQYYAYNALTAELTTSDNLNEMAAHLYNNTKSEDTQHIKLRTFKAKVPVFHKAMVEPDPATETPVNAAAIEVNETQASSIDIDGMVLGGFIAVVGAAAVAVALTLLPLIPSIVVASIGGTAILHGFSLFSESTGASMSDDEAFALPFYTPLATAG